jgi:hypothetical protein
MNDAFGKWIPLDVAAVGAVQSRRTAPYGVKRVTIGWEEVGMANSSVDLNDNLKPTN